MAHWFGWSRTEAPGPLVVRAGRAQDPTRYANPKIRRLVYDRDKGQCQHCGRDVSYDDCNIDHVWPWKHHGRTVPHNLVVSCRECNKAKGNQRIGLDAKPYLRPALRHPLLPYRTPYAPDSH